MNHEISDDDLLIHVMHNMPKEYDNVVETMEDRNGIDSDDGKALEITELRERLNRKYRTIMLRSGRRKYALSDFENVGSEKDEDDEETALVSAGKFKGRCNNCGKSGHKSRDCKDKKPESEKDQEKKPGY